MPVLGANYGEVYIPKRMPVYTPPKPKAVKSVYKPKPVYKAPVTYKPVAKAASSPVVQSAPVQSAPSGPSLDALMKTYLGQGTTDVNKLYDQQKTSQLAQLKAQRDEALGKINQQQTATKQSFYNQKNEADVVSAQNVQRLRELMASNGLNMSGDNITATATANSDRLNSLNALNTQEQAQMNEYSNQINDINNPAKQQAAVAQIESDRAKALMDAKNSATEKAWRQYTYNNMSANEKATLDWAKQSYGEDAAWKMFELNYNGELQKSTSQAELSAYTGFNGQQGGGGTAQFQSDMSKAVQKGVDPSWVPLLSEIVKRESSYNPYAKNPNSSAYGYGQFLTSTRNNYEKKTGLSYNDPVNQLVMMAQYVQDRYQNPQNALAFWNKNNWYILPLITVGSLLTKFTFGLF